MYYHFRIIEIIQMPIILPYFWASSVTLLNLKEAHRSTKCKPGVRRWGLIIVPLVSDFSIIKSLQEARCLTMQSFNMFAILTLVLIQGEAAYSQMFGCLGRVKDFPFSGCVKYLPKGDQVDIMVSPWDNIVGAYDCSKTEHKKPTCCAKETDTASIMDLPVWRLFCKEINGADIQ
ncbi:hypothetical protein KEM48_004397 [Puccinia striiformis f. sp. tritici PST-130]|nr:hypothetical protein KEM48_004397 [Puccinia striiformis f. sp. tritici PST-130]